MASGLALGPLLILALIVAGIVVATLAMRGRRSGEQQPACGKCAYLVKGLTTFTCPECGSDLREVGIVTANNRKTLSPLAKGILWTLALPIPAMLISGLIIAVGPQFSRQHVRRTLTPASGAYAQIVLAAMNEGSSSGNLQTEELHFRLTPKASTTLAPSVAELAVEPSKLGYRYVRPDGRVVEAADGLNAQVILDWMATAGVNVADNGIQTEASELYKQAYEMCSGVTSGSATPSFTSLGQSSNGFSQPAIWLVATLVVFWLALWLAGLWYIVRRRSQTSVAQT